MMRDTERIDTAVMLCDAGRTRTSPGTRLAPAPVIRARYVPTFRPYVWRDPARVGVRVSGNVGEVAMGRG